MRGSFVITSFQDSSKKNFPYKSFYNEDKQQIYTFYRQGHSLIINENDHTDYTVDKMTDLDLGQMVLIYNQSLISRSSGAIYFFKLKFDEDLERKKWVQYHEEDIRGLIYYTKGNIRFQITTDDKIFFFKMDEKTLMPSLENVMINFMNCNQMLYGKKVQYCITYKTNQRNFDIFSAKQHHSFKVQKTHENMEGAEGFELSRYNVVVFYMVNKIRIYDSKTLELMSILDVNLLETQTREKNEIIGMSHSPNQDLLAIITGRNLIRQEQDTNQIIIYRIMARGSKFHYFDPIRTINVKDRPELDKICMKFHFMKSPDERPISTLIFAKKDCLVVFNYMTEELTVLF